MTEPATQPSMIDAETRRRAIGQAQARGIRLPTFRELSAPDSIPADICERLAAIDPDAADPMNLWRIHWYNGADRRSRAEIPGHLVLPKELTGTDATIVVLLGSRFPMIGAHKVLPAYAGLVAELVTGRFDPGHHRAVWPSTGNYCRGGIAVSRILGCSGIAVLPEGMSRERFEWLERWVTSPEDIVRTPGTESNVKEIYDACHELARHDENVILNQFSAFTNYVAHRAVTGPACEHVFRHLRARNPRLALSAFVSATGSAGTIAAGDHLKAGHGTRIAAVEALECPTLLENGYGEHNIQGIGDKHVPLIHNVMNTDFAIAVSDRASDHLNLMIASEAGRGYLARRRRVDPELIAQLDEIGISGLANIVAAIKLAKYMRYGADDVVMTIATDSAAMYRTEREAFAARHYPGGFDEIDAGAVFGEFIAGAAPDAVIELGFPDRRRIFNLGYYTWVEQQGIPLDRFEARKHQTFWDELFDQRADWDRLIDEFNALADGN